MVQLDIVEISENALRSSDFTFCGNNEQGVLGTAALMVIVQWELGCADEI